MNGGVRMNDWNGNGKYDMSDKHMDYHQAHRKGSSGSFSGGGFVLLLAIITGVCPPVGVLIMILIMIFG